MLLANRLRMALDSSSSAALNWPMRRAIHGISRPRTRSNSDDIYSMVMAVRRTCGVAMPHLALLGLLGDKESALTDKVCL